jgi:hypothetical protein
LSPGRSNPLQHCDRLELQPVQWLSGDRRLIHKVGGYAPVSEEVACGVGRLGEPSGGAEDA